MYILGRVENDNSLGTPHITYEAILRLPVRRFSGWSMLVLLCLALIGRRSSAQATTSLQIDGTVLQRHELGIRGLFGFGRYDETLGDGGTRSIAASFTTDSVASAQIKQLAFSEAQIRTLTGNSAFAITAGQLTANANSRVLTVPLMLEFGLTSKLTIGVVVPLVETRTTSQVQLNPSIVKGNVGVNPVSPTAWATNNSIVTSLRSAAAALQSQLTTCQANPSGSGCATLLAQQSTVTSLIAATTPFATGIENLYGTGDTKPGVFFLPVTGTAAQSQIEDRLTNLRAQYAQFSQTIADGNPTGAASQGANTELNTLLLTAGYDSLAPRDRSSIGDIAIGATYQLVNTFDSTRAKQRGMLYRVALNATARIGTGEPYSRNSIFDNATGYGQPGAILGAATDIRFTPRVFLTAIGSYTMQFGTRDVARIANAGNSILPLTVPLPGTYSAGNEAALTLIPRYRLGGLFSIDGIYSLKYIGAEKYTYDLSNYNPPPDDLLGLPVTPAGAAAATGHILGFGFTYSSSLTDRNAGRLPYEASFRHTETIAASGGPIAKMFVDQLQLRIFIR
jgi:hypothetical protein